MALRPQAWSLGGALPVNPFLQQQANPNFLQPGNLPVQRVPVPVPVPVPVARDLSGRQLNNPFNDRGMPQAGPLFSPLDRSPQGASERNWQYGGRQAYNAFRDTAAYLADIPGALENTGRAVANNPYWQAPGKFVLAAGQGVADLVGYANQRPIDQLRQIFEQGMIPQESGGRHVNPKTGKITTSPKGALGVAQIMPDTAPEAAALAGLPWRPDLYRSTSPEGAAYNKALGWAYLQQKYKETGNVEQAVAAYNAGLGGVQKAQAAAQQSGNPWQSHLPNETQGYLSSIQQRMGQLAANWGAAPPDVMGMLGQTRGQVEGYLEQSRQAQLQPTEFKYSEAALPERPTPKPFEAPDFSKGDAAFEQTRPVAPYEGAEGEKMKLRDLRRGYFQGMAQALASLGEGAGVGKILATLGAGSLMGRGRAQEDIDAKFDRYDDMMVEFNRALANREDGKAQQIRETMNLNLQQDNKHAEALWQDALAKHERDNKFQMLQDGTIISEQATYDDQGRRHVTMTRKPSSAYINAAHARDMAQTAQTFGMAGVETSMDLYKVGQSQAQMALATLAKNGGNDGQDAILLGAATRINDIVSDGTWRDLIPDDIQRQADAEILQMTNGVPYNMLDNNGKADVNKYVEGELWKIFMSNPTALRNLFVFPEVQGATARRQARKVVTLAPPKPDNGSPFLGE